MLLDASAIALLNSYFLLARDENKRNLRSMEFIVFTDATTLHRLYRRLNEALGCSSYALFSLSLSLFPSAFEKI